MLLTSQTDDNDDTITNMAVCQGRNYQ